LIFTNAYANSTWTRPSHVTLLTGLLPHEHGVEYQDSVLPADLPTIPVPLRDLGYFSCASTGSGHVSDYVGMAKDFDQWVQVDNRPGPAYLATLLQPIERSQEILASVPTQPVFALVHTYYVHEYYLDESDFARRSFASLREWNMYRIDKALSLQSPECAERVRGRYAYRVAEFDAILAEYLEWLQHSPLADNLCIIVTSDHGESLFESHLGTQVYGHMGAPSPEKVRIPLVISGLGRGEVDDLVSLRDIPAIIVELARSGELVLPHNQSIESEYLTDVRSAGHKVRHTSVLHGDGTWVHARSPGFSVDDRRQRPDLPQEHLDQLMALGYVQ